MTAELRPRRPGLTERLRHLVFGELRAADDRRYRPHARLPAGPEEVRDFRLLAAHNPLTLPAAELHTLRPEIFPNPGCFGDVGPLAGEQSQLDESRLAGVDAARLAREFSSASASRPAIVSPARAS